MMMKVVVWKSPKYLRGILCRLFHITYALSQSSFCLCFFHILRQADIS